MRILLVTSRYPWPARRGDQLRAGQLLRFLGSEHQVVLLTPEPGPGQPSPPAEHADLVTTYRPPGAAGRARGLLRATLTGLPVQSGLFTAPDLGRRLRRLAAGSDLVILQLARLAGHLEDLGGAPLAVDLIDSLSLSFARRAEVDRPWLAPLLRAESRRLALWEGRLLDRSRVAWVVAQRDHRHLAAGPGAGAAGRLAVVPVAVEARPDPVRPSREGPPVLTLTGNLGYFVNRDAAGWWLAGVWPALRQRRPDLRLVIAGARPPRRLSRAARAAGAELVNSPRDLGAVLAGATLALAPLRCGAGQPLKVLEAWAAGVPVVASPWATAGTTGEAGRDLAVAESPQEWVDTVLDLLDDPQARRRLAAGGRERLARDYAPERVRAAWLASLRALA